jgi:hypothetical protein
VSPQAAKAGIGGWVNAHPGETAALIGASIGALILLRAKAAKTTSGATTSQGGAYGPGAPVGVAPGYLVAPTADTSATDAISSVQPELDAVERQIQHIVEARQKLAQIPPGAPATTNPPVYTGNPGPGMVHTQ